MNPNLILSLAYLFIGIGFTLSVLIIIIGTIAGITISYTYGCSYKKAVINVINSNPTKKDSDLVESIKTEYSNYRHTNINAFYYFKLEIINSKLISELRNDKYKKYYSHKINNNDIANKLERINKLIQEELIFKEDDIRQIVNDIQSLSNIKADEAKINNLAEKVKIKFASCIAFCNGRIHEKDININDLERKVKKGNIGKFFAWTGWIIGIISGLITIFK